MEDFSKDCPGTRYGASPARNDCDVRVSGLLSIAVQAHLKWQLLPGDRPQGRGTFRCLSLLSLVVFEACGLVFLTVLSVDCGFHLSIMMAFV